MNLRSSNGGFRFTLSPFLQIARAVAVLFELYSTQWQLIEFRVWFSTRNHRRQLYTHTYIYILTTEVENSRAKNHSSNYFSLIFFPLFVILVLFPRCDVVPPAGAYKRS